MNNPNAAENLTPFKPGQSGNPEGKIPGTKNRSTIARKVLEMKFLFVDETFDKLKAKYPDIKKSMTVEEIATIIQMDEAIQTADTNAYKAVLDSAYGAPKQEMEHSGGVKIITIEQDPASEPLTDGTNGD